MDRQGRKCSERFPGSRSALGSVGESVVLVPGMPPYRLSTRHIRKSLDALAAEHPDVRRALARVGYPAERRRAEGFETLLRIIVGQQVSVAAAAAIHGRLEEALKEDVSAAKLLRVRETTLQRAGLSRPKVRYARGLARAVRSGELDFEAIAALPDEEAMARIQAVPGLGPWSAQIYVMFSLGRPDVWPHDDVGALRGLQKIARLVERPTPEEGASRVAPMSPHRSAMALLAWRCAGSTAL